MTSHYDIKDLFIYWNSQAYYSEVDGSNTIEYFCTPSVPEAALTDKVWKIMKVTKITATGKYVTGKSVVWAGGTPDCAFVATDLNTVKALTYL